MKNLIKKIRNKRLKGNISLLVILILLASSVISLLSINQIQRLISYWNMTFNYFRSFYIAKAWTELGLAEVYLRWDGFNQRVLSWESIVQDNLVWIYTGFNPYFNMYITWSFQYLTEDIRESSECSWWNKIKLNSWDLIMLSFFSDGASTIKDALSTWYYHPVTLPSELIKEVELKNYNVSNHDLTFSFFTYSGDSMGDDVIIEGWKSASELRSFLNDVPETLMNTETPKYLTIKNLWNNTIEFCVYMNDRSIPYSNSLINVQANYGDVEVWIQSIVKKWVPGWAWDVLWSTP